MRQRKPEPSKAVPISKPNSDSSTILTSTSSRKLTLLSFYLKTGGAFALLIAIAVSLSFSPVSDVEVGSLTGEQVVSTSPPQTAALGKLSFWRRTYVFAGVVDTLFTANADGTEQTALTQYPPFSATTSDWSPDGTKIVFASSIDIFAINSNSSNPVNLTNTVFSASENNPSWSVTGKIAFERDNQIWVMNADGSNQAPLSGIVQPSPTAPAWSPDGSQLAFISNGEIYVINANGTNERRITTISASEFNPDWSPDGSKIIFSRFEAGFAAGIFVINADGTNPVNLSASDDREPVWSPDGTKIAFVRKSTDVNGIYLMNADGSNQVRIIADYQQPRGYENNSPAWQPVQSTAASRPAFDFDGDRKADISVFRPSNGFWYLLNSQTGFSSQQFGTATDKLTPADFDGDGRTDVAVWRPAAGDESKFYILSSASNTVRTESFALAEDVPLAADWDGDLKSDLTVYRKGASGGQSYFYYRPSSQPGVNFISVPWGAGGDKPVLGDYDADGKADAAVFRTSTGGWFVRLSSNGQLLAAQFGISSDVPLTADFDGDSKTDIAVFRPSDGGWYRLNSSNGQFFAAQFGLSSDLPVPADYDGDAKADIAVWRPANGEWYRINSTNNQFSAVPFGIGKINRFRQLSGEMKPKQFFTAETQSRRRERYI